MLLYGPLPYGHDTTQHLAFTKTFSQQLWAGDPYPRWLTEMNGGFGSPSFFIYPPLPAYVYALLTPLANWLKFNAFNFSAYLALFGSGICAFLWLHTMVEQKAALAGAMLYMIMPYHLWADFYVRCALPECWALVWMPLILFFTARIACGKRHATVGLAVSFALLILSHLITVLMFFPVPIVLSILMSKSGEKTRSVFRVLLAMLLGTGLTGVYLFSAIFHARYISASRLVANFDWAVHILHFGKALFAVSEDPVSRFLRSMSWLVISMVILVSFCGAALMMTKTMRRDCRNQIVFWLIVCASSVFMMSELSVPLWRAVPKLQQAVQFPWRFNCLLCVGVIPILTVFLSRVSWRFRFPASLLLIPVLLVLAVWPLTYRNVWQRYHSQFREKPPLTEADGWFHQWSQPGTEYPLSARLVFEDLRQSVSPGPKVKFDDGRDLPRVLLWKPRHIEFQTDSSTGGWVTINQFYYPAWQAEQMGDAALIPLTAAMPQGVLKLWVPPGPQTVRLDIPTSVAETVGKWTSGFCLLLCVGLFWRKAAVLPVESVSVTPSEC